MRNLDSERKMRSRARGITPKRDAPRRSFPHVAGRGMFFLGRLWKNRTNRTSPLNPEDNPRNLGGYFLVSEIGLMDPNFVRSVILMITHDENGAFGLIVNRPFKLTLGELVEGLEESPASSIPVYVGGPVQQELLFILHTAFPRDDRDDYGERPVEGVIFEPATQSVVEYLKDDWSALPEQQRPAVRLYARLLRLGPRAGRGGVEGGGLGGREGELRYHLSSQPRGRMGGCFRQKRAAVPDHSTDRFQAVDELTRPLASPHPLRENGEGFSMGRILKFSRDRQDGPGSIDAAKIWEYVLPRLDFPLPDFISREIDTAIGDIWNASENEIDFYDCVNALESLRGKDILIPSTRREKIVSLIFEYLEKNGYPVSHRLTMGDRGGLMNAGRIHDRPVSAPVLGAVERHVRIPQEPFRGHALARAGRPRD